MTSCLDLDQSTTTPATLATSSDDGALRGHLTFDEAQTAFAAANARRLLVTHRPVELETPPRFELAPNGLVHEL